MLPLRALAALSARLKEQKATLRVVAAWPRARRRLQIALEAAEVLDASSDASHCSAGTLAAAATRAAAVSRWVGLLVRMTTDTTGTPGNEARNTDL